MKLFLSILFMIMVWQGIAASITHTVKRGETIETIAKEYNVTPKAIYDANPGLDKLIYIGLKITIPTNENDIIDAGNQNMNMLSQDNPNIAESKTSETIEITNNDENANTHSNVFDIPSSFEIGYNAQSFDDVKASGSYGFGFTSYFTRLTPRLHLGAHISPVNMNFGLIDSKLTTALVKMGPSLGYYISSNTFLTMPLDVLCAIGVGDAVHGTGWGIALSPSIMIGGKHGIYFGPQLTQGFSSGSKLSFGFQAGIYL